MYKLIKVEIMKLKRSYIFRMCILGSLCAPLMTFLVCLNRQSMTGEVVKLKDFLLQANMLIAFLIGTLLYGLVATYIIDKEFSDDMLKHLLSIPVKSQHLILSKLVVVSLCLLYLTCFSFVFGLIFAAIGGFSHWGITEIGTSLLFYLRTCVIFIPLMLPMMYLTIRFKGFVAPIASSISIVVVLFIVIQSKFIALFPWSGPMLYGTVFAEMDQGDYIGELYYSLLGVLFIGFISYLGCVRHLDKKEVV